MKHGAGPTQHNRTKKKMPTQKQLEETERKYSDSRSYSSAIARILNNIPLMRDTGGLFEIAPLLGCEKGATSTKFNDE